MLFDRLVKLMPGAKVGNGEELKIPTVTEINKEYTQEQRRNEAIILFSRLSEQGNKGTFQKSEIYEMLGGTKSTYRFLWNDPIFLDWCRSMNIDVQYHSVVFQ